MRHSGMLDVGSTNATTPLIALLIAMLLPPDVVPFPEIDRQSQGFKNVEHAMRWWSRRDDHRTLRGENNDGLGGGDNENRDEKGGKKPGAPSDSDADSRPKKRRNKASGQLSVTAKSLQFAVEAGSVMSIEFTDGAVHPDCPVYTIADALLKLTTEPGARHHSSLAGNNLKRSTLALSRLPPSSQLPSTAWRGVVHDHPVILRKYRACQFDALAAELNVFARLEGLRPKVVLCHGVVAARDFSWMALLMEDSAIACSGGWTALPWSEARALFNAFFAVHRRAKWSDGDAAEPMVLRPPWGGDTGTRRLAHRCEGWMCSELEELRCLLEGE
ncbi:hypothetical protein C8R45DRAFT_240519 [Mycena sanguinolenta]|nr:hypothetical protein C8R45DRAFT_240519 [Mycena sanguinolenta]